MRAAWLSLLLMPVLLACDKDTTATTVPQVSAKENQIADYKTARSVLWRSLYPQGGETFYCGQPFKGGYHKGINIEHVFPMSWVTKSLRCGTRSMCRARSKVFNLIEADLHNLFPARSLVNEDRSSFPFGEVRGEARRYGLECDFEVDEQARIAEPAPAVRGDVARAMFYMAHRYHQHGLAIFARQGRMLHAWHLADPPSEQERQRNLRIEKLQGNRNLFIDDPAQLSSLIADGFFF